MKNSILISIAILLAMVLTSGYGARMIDEGAIVAAHWNMQGEVDGYLARNHLLVGGPLLAFGITLLFLFAPFIDPRRSNVHASRDAFYVSWIGTLIFLAGAHASLVFAAIRGDTQMPILNEPFFYVMCLFIIVVGNFIAKTRSNFFLGIKTPWTLSSENSWAVTNRLGGWLFVLTGLGAAATAAIRSPKDGFAVFIAGLLTTFFVTLLVSYLVWRDDQKTSGDTA